MIPKVGRENTFRVRRYFRLFPLVFFLTGVLAFLLSGRRKSLTHHPSQPILLEEVPSGGTPSAADDLTLIEGIGPKVAAVLHAGGITRFEQLAAFPPAELKRLLIAAGNRLSDPATWPEQAALAASGDWEGLKALQSSLTRGRRTG